MKYMRYDKKDKDGNVVDSKFSFFCNISGDVFTTYKIALPKSMLSEDYGFLKESFYVRLCLIDCVVNPDDSRYTRRQIKDVCFLATVGGNCSSMYIKVPKKHNADVQKFILVGNHRPWCQVVISKTEEVPVVVPTFYHLNCVGVFDRHTKTDITEVYEEHLEHLLDYSFTFVGRYNVINDRVVFSLPHAFKKYSQCFLGYWTTKNLCWNVDVFDNAGTLVYSNDSYPILVDGRSFLYFRNRDEDFIFKKPIGYKWRIELKCIGYY